jgi:hypothetical protein
VAASPGPDIGSTIFLKVCHIVAPSIHAASSSERGQESKNERISHATSDRLKVR